MVLSALNNPSEFFTVVSAKLLAQPEPQYLYSTWWKTAMGVALPQPSSIGLPGRDSSGQGAPYTRPEDDRLKLDNVLPSQIFAVKHNFAGGKGHTIMFNRPVYTNSVYTVAAREIGVNQTISLQPIRANGDQVPLTIRRFGGPYDVDNARIAPMALDAFDATMGVHNLAEIIGLHMRRDYDAFYDALHVQLLDATSNVVYPNTISTDDGITGFGLAPLSYEQLQRTARRMTENNLPTLPDGSRVLVVTPMGMAQLKNDPQFARYARYFRDSNPLFSMRGWFDSIPEFHCFVNNTLSKVTNASSVPVHYGHAIAPGALMGGLGKMPEVIPATDDNYKQTPKAIWIGHSAHGLADSRFVYSVRYGADAN